MILDQINLFGDIPIRQEVTIIQPDLALPMDRMIGWRVYESIGFGMINTNALNSIRINFLSEKREKWNKFR